MITPTSSDTRLNIVLTTMNRALSEAVRNATPEQLETLNRGKDVGSLLNSLFSDKLSGSRSDKVLLEILKNSPAFTNMGNVGDALGNLVEKLKASGFSSGRTAALESFSQNTMPATSSSLQKQIANSGVFMEGKIASAIAAPDRLLDHLEHLSSLLSKSTLKASATLLSSLSSVQEQAQSLKNGVNSQNAAQTLQSLNQFLQSLETLRSTPDTAFSSQTASLLNTLSTALALSPSDAEAIRSPLYKLFPLLLSSTSSSAQELLGSLESLLASSGNESLSSNASAFADRLQNFLEGSDTVLGDDAAEVMKKLSEFSSPETLLLEPLLDKATEEDLKSALLGLSDELSASPSPSTADLADPINRVLLMIDYHQLVSSLEASNSLFFPFAWDQLEEGSVSFKKNRDKKFYCEINLNLKEYGKLDLLMGLYEGNQLDIQMQTDQEELRERLFEHLPELRSVLIDSGLTPRTLRIFQKNDPIREKASLYGSGTLSGDIGFEVKG